MKLSATVITLNEKKNIVRCLSSIKDLVDEIILVDSSSTDETVDLAKKFGAKVYYRKFDNYANQKNFALEKTTGDWILSLDADEEITPELAEEIKSVISQQSSVISGYSISRKNIILGKYIKFTRWQPDLDRHIWLWKKSAGKWIGDVHEEVIVKGKVGKLKSFKVHYQYETVREFVEMINRYTELEAQGKVNNGQSFSIFKLFYDPIYNFLVRYIYRFGFLDGWRGFVLSYLMAIYHLTVWIKVWDHAK